MERFSSSTFRSRCSFGFFARADVPNRRRYQDALRAFERAQHEFDGEVAAVLVPRDELDAGADLLRQRVFRGTKRVGDQPFREAFGNDVFHFLAQQFIAAVAELLFGLHIQQHDLPALVDHHHGVGGGFEQPAVAAFHLRQMSFRILAHADVADGRRHQDAFRAFERAQHDLDGKLGAILAPPGKLQPGANLLGQRFGGGAGAVGDQPFGETLGNDAFHFLPHQFVAAVAKLLLRLHVQQDDLSCPASPPPWRRERLRAARDSGLPSAPDVFPRPCAR